MTDVLLAALAAVAAITMILAALILFRISRVVIQEPLTKDLIGQLLRGETDLVRKSGEDQARSLRQELGDHLKGFQDTTIKAFGVLTEGVNNQMRGFGERLDGGIKTVEQRVEGIAEKLKTDIGQMGEDASKNRDALR